MSAESENTLSTEISDAQHTSPHDQCKVSTQVKQQWRWFLRGTPCCTLWLICLICSFHATDCSCAQETSGPEFNQDILPILSDKCFYCHGPDENHREAGLRLDQFDTATTELDSGEHAVVPGDVSSSELIHRIESEDESLQMPPVDSGKTLSARERRLLKEWIQNGAQYEKHWAFVAPKRHDPPSIDRQVLQRHDLNPDAWSQNPIDAFVLSRLRHHELVPSQPAAPHTLLRRVSFDLTGLPPSLEQVEQFEVNPDENAYRQFVEELLKSRHYGERMAMWWLDAARYSDTDGYQQDATRSNWPWRDWVIQSFNDNKPFDQFTIEQFAGDLIPNSTPEQQLATCFHRNHMTNGEGGRDPEESRIDYVIDRVNTTGTVWLGLTLGCAQCHSHKFDPISQQDYYQLSAFFNSIDEDGRAGGGAKPYLKYTSPYAKESVEQAEQIVTERKSQLQHVQQQADKQFQTWLTEQIERVRGGFTAWNTLTELNLESVEGTLLNESGDGIVHTSGPDPFQDDYRITASSPLPVVTGIRLEVLPGKSGFLARGASGTFILTDVKMQVKKAGSSQLRDIELASAVADKEIGVKGRRYGKISDTLDDDPRNGWTLSREDSQQTHIAVFALKEPLHLNADEQLVFVMLHRSTTGDANISSFRLSVCDQPGRAVRSLDQTPLEQLAELQSTDPDKIPGNIRKQLFDQFLTQHKDWQAVRTALTLAERQLNEARRAANPVNVMVLKERDKPRQTHILQRGVWNQKGDAVNRNVPKSILSRPSDAIGTRLDLANWLVSKDNPLTARVVVNHLWQLCFGQGIVRTPEDFGLQGERPTHPQLLDWLAMELMEHDWDVQHILRLIVTSQTYRQSGKVSSELLALDPDNRLLARGARYRLPAWMLRDAALSYSGLLNRTTGGPPVRPYQPVGVWKEIFMGRFTYEPSQGALQYRRTVYAFWRRSSAPTFLFDSAQRRVCEVRLNRTNTPLHALTLLNDETMLEASRELARGAVGYSDDIDKQIHWLCRRILQRSPNSEELEILRTEFQSAQQHFSDATTDSKQLLSVGQLQPIDIQEDPDITAGMVIASMLLNLDETLTHE